MGKELKIGVAGAGRWGKNILRNLWDMGRAKVLYDPDPDRVAAAVKTRPGLYVASSFDDLLERVDAGPLPRPR